MRAWFGLPVALVAQDGLENLHIPWCSFDALFLGGSTAWKLGPAARDLTRQAKGRRKHVHMGRVNSLDRLRYAAAIGCDSADGTYVAHGPDVNLPKLLRWLDDVNSHEAMFDPQVYRRVAAGWPRNYPAEAPQDDKAAGQLYLFKADKATA
jgi:hypothetical protein